MVAHLLTQLHRAVGAPFDFVHLPTQHEVAINVGLLEVVQHMLAEVQQGNPSIQIIHFFKPLFIVAIVRAVIVEHILTNQNKARYAAIDHFFNHIALEGHDVVVEAIVPFSDELDDTVPFVVVAVKYFNEEGVGADIVPLWMDVMVVNAVSEVHLAVFAFEEGRIGIFTGYVVVSPVVVGFDVMHFAELASEYLGMCCINCCTHTAVLAEQALSLAVAHTCGFGDHACAAVNQFVVGRLHINHAVSFYPTEPHHD